jgi:hypothetical protein
MNVKNQKGFVEILASGFMFLGLLSSVVLLSLSSARAKSRDAKRLADIRQTASALELYFNNKKAYPETLNQTTPNYIGVVPAPPKPADGTCSEEQNQYAYKKLGKEQYELNFCLGNSAGGYLAGMHTLTEKGIK